MTRILPGVHVTLNDLSAVPEGQDNLTVGMVIKSKRGAMGEAILCTTPIDLVNTLTFKGTVSPSDDLAFHSAIKILSKTNSFYVVRAASKPLFGGLLIKKEQMVGEILGATKESKKITIEGEAKSALTANETIRVSGTSTIDGRYTVESVTFIPESTGVVAHTEIQVAEDLEDNYTWSVGAKPKVLLTKQPVKLNQVKIADITSIDHVTSTITVTGNKESFLIEGDRIQIKESEDSNGKYTVESAVFDSDANKTNIVVEETIEGVATTGKLFRDSITNVENYKFEEDDLFLITGKDQGAYNSDIEIKIVSTTESKDKLTEDNIFTIEVLDANTKKLLENSIMVSRRVDAKALDGSNIYLEDVVDNTSAYIRVVNNVEVDEEELPCDTVDNARLGGGFDGKEVTEADMIAALQLFADKTIPISILANGSQETPLFQQAMIDIAENRKDCMAFLSSRKIDELATYSSRKASNVVNYKKNILGSTSYLGAIYAPHVTVPDIFNSRSVTIGSDAVAIAGWLDILVNKGYPFAYAGPSDGLVTGAMCSWKIGDTSGEATLLNDASHNYIAFDAKVGRYYMQCQNTLQVANSSLRNVGAVLNILDIKETFAIYFKEFLQKPITTYLREQILNKGKDHMNLMLSLGRVTNYSLADITTDLDLSNNTLRYVLALALTPYAQNIYLAMNIVDQGYDFSILY